MCTNTRLRNCNSPDERWTARCNGTAWARHVASRLVWREMARAPGGGATTYGSISRIVQRLDSLAGDNNGRFPRPCRLRLHATPGSTSLSARTTSDISCPSVMRRTTQRQRCAAEEHLAPLVVEGGEGQGNRQPGPRTSAAEETLTSGSTKNCHSRHSAS